MPPQPSLLQQLAKTLGIGRLFYRLYHAPKGQLETTFRRGLLNSLLTYQGQKQMEAAAYTLPPVELDPTTDPLDIYFLSGQKFWYQTCFCAYSMAKQSQVNLRLNVYDDGTLKPVHVAQFKRLFANARVILRDEIEANLDRHLPISQFPTLRSRRLEYPNLKKLTDIHVGSAGGWKLILDSDMLFFHPPTLLINWLKDPQHPCHMVDTETSYGYSEALMTHLAQAPIPQRLNVGICGLNSEMLDWEELEHWCRILQAKEGKHYYQEQAMIAMLMAKFPQTVAPEKEYLVMPDRQEAIAPQAILHHYVADSKPWYFRYGWRHILTQ